MAASVALYSQPEIVRGQQCTAVHLLRFRLSAGDVEAFRQEVAAVCQQSVSTPALLGHARHRVTSSAQAAELE